MDDTPATYVLRLQGVLDERWAAWFAGMAVTSHADDTTTLAGPLVDQAALHGVLRKIRDLGLTILSVERRSAADDAAAALDAEVDRGDDDCCSGESG